MQISVASAMKTMCMEFRVAHTPSAVSKHYGVCTRNLKNAILCYCKLSIFHVQIIVIYCCKNSFLLVIRYPVAARELFILEA